MRRAPEMYPLNIDDKQREYHVKHPTSPWTTTGLLALLFGFPMALFGSMGTDHNLYILAYLGYGLISYGAFGLLMGTLKEIATYQYWLVNNQFKYNTKVDD
jgi:hypothetical protein